MSKNRYLTRPRTKLYDANYNIGESYYKSALDSIDRKYSPRALSTPPRNSSAQAESSERLANVFEDEDLVASRRRAEKTISESNVFDTHRGSSVQKHLDDFQKDLNGEKTSLLQRIRANRKEVAPIDDVGMDSVFNTTQSRRMIDLSNRILDTVAINGSSRKTSDQQIAFEQDMKLSQKRNENLTKWKPLEFETDKESAAAVRAKQTKNRLLDIEDEIADLHERQEARNRRMAKFKAFIVKNSEETEAMEKAMDSVSISNRKEGRTVHF